MPQCDSSLYPANIWWLITQPAADIWHCYVLLLLRIRYAQLGPIRYITMRDIVYEDNAGQFLM